MYLLFEKARDGRCCNRRAALIERWPTSGRDLESLLSVLSAAVSTSELGTVPQLTIGHAPDGEQLLVAVGYRATTIRGIATDPGGNPVASLELMQGIIVTEIEGS